MVSCRNLITHTMVCPFLHCAKLMTYDIWKMTAAHMQNRKPCDHKLWMYYQCSLPHLTQDPYCWVNRRIKSSLGSYVCACSHERNSTSTVNMWSSLVPTTLGRWGGKCKTWTMDSGLKFGLDVGSVWWAVTTISNSKSHKSSVQEWLDHYNNVTILLLSELPKRLIIQML